MRARTAVLGVFLWLAAALSPVAAQNRTVATTTLTPAIIFDAYNREVTSRIARRVRYPSVASRRNLQGKVLIQFDVHPSGRLTAVRVVESSGVQVLDAAGVDAIRRAAPFPPTPGHEPRRFRVPLNFYL